MDQNVQLIVSQHFSSPFKFFMLYFRDKGVNTLTIHLSILEQSMLSEGQTAKEALDLTIEMAKLADELGYRRFWVAEHHGSEKLASSTPEILMAHLASQTKRIRIGSGGIMLPHYSAYKIAENAKLLEALFPERIDIGLGRAPGGSQVAHLALRDGQPRHHDIFPEQVEDLRHYLHDRKTQFPVYAAPSIETVPAVWMLGSSPSSAQLAAAQGLPYMYAQFISGNQEIGTYAASLYHQQFNRSGETDAPENAVSIFFSCAETEEEAERIAQGFDYAMLWLETGRANQGTPSPETIAKEPLSAFEMERIKHNRSRMIVGTPKSCKQQIEALAQAYGAKEVMLVMIAYDYADKMKAYQLIADEMLN